MIRKAVIEDTKTIHKILSYYGTQGLLLPRPLSELYEHLRDFFVLVENARDARILGVCALGISWEDLAEVRSLAIVEGQQGKRYGSKLVEACLEEARTLGVKRVFALTYLEDFFSKIGFRVTEKSVLPQKIWADCLRCLKFPDCDETAMILEL
ncbi:MAG: N-acetyltransferase [Desulfobacteraceae bacterium]|jgi:amino-acid N-acetyltransferase